MAQEEPNYLAQAFKSQYNLIGLGTALGFALLSGTVLPLLLAAGVEMVVLPLVAGNERFQRLVPARASSEQREEQQSRRQAEISGVPKAVSRAELLRCPRLSSLSA